MPVKSPGTPCHCTPKYTHKSYTTLLELPPLLFARTKESSSSGKTSVPTPTLGCTGPSEMLSQILSVMEPFQGICFKAKQLALDLGKVY